MTEPGSKGVAMLFMQTRSWSLVLDTHTVTRREPNPDSEAKREHRWFALSPHVAAKGIQRSDITEEQWVDARLRR